MSEITMREFNFAEEQFKFRSADLNLLEAFLCGLFVGRETPRNKWGGENAKLYVMMTVTLGAIMLGLAKLFIGYPLLTIIGFGFALSVCVAMPNIEICKNPYTAPVLLVVGIVSYFYPFMTLKIFSFDVFPYFMLLMAASSLLALVRRAWNQMAWAIIDHLYRKYDVEPVDEALLDEWYENRDTRESAQNNE